MQKDSKRPKISPPILAVIGIVLVLTAAFARLPDGARAATRDLGFLLVIVYFAIQFVERPLREQSTREIRDTAVKEIIRMQQETVGRLLRGWLPPAHFQLLQQTTFQPFMREEMRYRIDLVRRIDGNDVPRGYLVEEMEYRYRVRNVSENPESVDVGISMSKECEGILPGLPHMTVSAEFEDGTEAIQNYAGSGDDKINYREYVRRVQLGPGEAVNAEIYTRELRLESDREVIVCPMPAQDIIVDIEAPEDLELTAEALQPGPGQLRTATRPGGRGQRFVLPSPVLPGAVIEIKWRPRNVPVERQN